LKKISSITTLCKELLDTYKTAESFVVRHANKKVKNLFTEEEWMEMKNDFNEIVEFKDINEKEELYELFDKIQE
ncbi:18179_t:CDS:2, partial [Racocetra persica]